MVVSHPSGSFGWPCHNSASIDRDILWCPPPPPPIERRCAEEADKNDVDGKRPIAAARIVHLRARTAAKDIVMMQLYSKGVIVS